MHSSAGLRQGVLAAGTLVRGKEEDEEHNGSRVLYAMFSAQLDPSPADWETEVQVVMRRSMAPSRSENGHSVGRNINLIADKGTHLSEHDGLNTGEK